MGNTSGNITDSIEELSLPEELEEILEPFAREGFICELSSGIVSVLVTQVLEVLGVASLAVIRVVATKDDSQEEVFEDYDSQIYQENLWDEHFSDLQ